MNLTFFLMPGGAYININNNLIFYYYYNTIFYYIITKKGIYIYILFIIF